MVPRRYSAASPHVLCVEGGYFGSSPRICMVKHVRGNFCGPVEVI